MLVSGIWTKKLYTSQHTILQHFCGDLDGDYPLMATVIRKEENAPQNESEETLYADNMEL